MDKGLLKVFIIDDEKLVRELLKSCISWEEIGLTIVGEAPDAARAIEAVCHLLPDIIITDICMPNMDGLELSSEIKDQYPEMKIVILTGYDEFEYAKRGIQIGITDFLLKPINDDEIKEVMSTLRESIIKERRQTEEYEGLKKQVHRNASFLSENFFNELIQKKNADKPALIKMQEQLGLNINEDFFQTAVIEINEKNDDSDEKKLDLHLRCIDLIRNCVKNMPFIYVFFDRSDRPVVFSNNREIDLWESCEMIKLILKERYSCNVSIGIGNARYNLDKIWASYKEACDALEYKYFAGENNILCYSDYFSSKNPPNDLDIDRINRFVFCIRAGLKTEMMELIEEIFSHNDNGLITKEQGRTYACNLISCILNVLMEKEINYSDVFDKDEQPFNQIFKFDTLKETKEFLFAFAENAIEAIINISNNKSRKIIYDVKEYIKTNYSDSEITLTKIADKFFINLSYLSRIFKEETGLTFLSYLMKLRMERAVELINSTDRKAYEISEIVGFKDPHYFSVCFKRHVGVSLSQYKNIDYKSNNI